MRRMIGASVLASAVVAIGLAQGTPTPAGTLAGTNAGEIAFAFAFVPVLAAVVPWGYVWREYVAMPRSVRQQRGNKGDQQRGRR